MPILDRPVPSSPRPPVRPARPDAANRPVSPFRAPIAALEDNLGLVDPDTEETPPTAVPDSFRFGGGDFTVEDDDEDDEVVPVVVAPRPSRPAPPPPEPRPELEPTPRSRPQVVVAREVRPEPRTIEVAPRPIAEPAAIPAWAWLALGLSIGANLVLILR